MWVWMMLLACNGDKTTTDSGDTSDSSSTTETGEPEPDPNCDDTPPEITALDVLNGGLSNGQATIEIALEIADTDANSLNQMDFQIWIEDDLDGQVDQYAAGAVTTNNQLDNQTCDSITTQMSLYLPIETMQIPDGAGGYKVMPYNTPLELAVVMSDAQGLASQLVYATFVSPQDNGLDATVSGNP